MGISHVTLSPSYNTNGDMEYKKTTYHFGKTKVMTNKGLMWQVRLCEKPGVVEVIASFKESKDAIAFMTLISENKGHNIMPERAVTGAGFVGKHYFIEHNSSSEYKELI